MFRLFAKISGDTLSVFSLFLLCITSSVMGNSTSHGFAYAPSRGLVSVWLKTETLASLTMHASDVAGTSIFWAM